MTESHLYLKDLLCKGNMNGSDECECMGCEIIHHVEFFLGEKGVVFLAERIQDKVRKSERRFGPVQ